MRYIKKIIQNMMNKHCAACGAVISGRIDKKFCDHYCRSDFNNTITREKTQLVRLINKILNENRVILEKFYTRKKAELTTDILIAAGFDFNYFTHREIDEEGLDHFFCYEYGYTKVTEKKILLKKGYQGWNNTSH